MTDRRKHRDSRKTDRRQTITDRQAANSRKTDIRQLAGRGNGQTERTAVRQRSDRQNRV